MRARKRSIIRKSVVLKSIFLFLILNVVCLLLFYLYHHPTPSPANNHDGFRHREDLLIDYDPTEKAWPDLPSFIPWVDAGFSPRPRSCEAYFGNGFSRSIDVIKKTGDKGGWFRCFYSETLRSSVCEGGNVRMDPSRITMSRGGERLDEVIGRSEEDELPKFQDGAFVVEKGSGNAGNGEMMVDEDFLEKFVPQGQIGFHTMRNLIGSIRVVSDSNLDCSQWLNGSTLLVTRFEYANMFHTTTDWYSAYTSSRITNLPTRPRLVFLDGHCKAPLEQTWEALFSGLKYAKNFSGPVCFKRIVFVPLGYETAMFKGLSESFSCQGALASELRKDPEDQKTARVSEFGEMLRAAFNLPIKDEDIPKPVSGHNVLFVRREDYLAHPRHDGKVQSRLSNEQDVFDALTRWAANYNRCKINIVNGLFAHMGMKDQLKDIQEASVVIGAHGAGLTHLVAARRDTVVLEIISSMYRRPHFELISKWKGLEYHAINLAGSYAEPSRVIKELTGIMQNLGC